LRKPEREKRAAAAVLKKKGRKEGECICLDMDSLAHSGTSGTVRGREGGETPSKLVIHTILLQRGGRGKGRSPRIQIAATDLIGSTMHANKLGKKGGKGERAFSRNALRKEKKGTTPLEWVSTRAALALHFDLHRTPWKKKKRGGGGGGNFISAPACKGREEGEGGAGPLFQRYPDRSADPDIRMRKKEKKRRIPRRVCLPYTGKKQKSGKTRRLITEKGRKEERRGGAIIAYSLVSRGRKVPHTNLATLHTGG